MKKILQVLFLSAIVVACDDNRSNYFCDNHAVIGKPQDSVVLNAKMFIPTDSIMNFSYIYCVGDKIVATSYSGNDSIFSVYDIEGNLLSRFGSFGRASNEFSRGMKLNGQDDNGCFFVNDVNLNVLKVIDLNKSIDSSVCQVKDVIKTGNRVMASFIDKKDQLIYEQETSDNYRIVVLDTYKRSVQKKIDLYKPRKDPFEAYADIALINQENDRLVFAMRFLNQVNFLSLTDVERKSVSLYEDARIVDDKNNAKEYYCDLTANESYIYALYMNQFQEDAYEKVKPMEIHVFDWNGNFVKKLVVNEYIIRIAISSKGTLFGLDLDGNIYKYAI